MPRKETTAPSTGLPAVSRTTPQTAAVADGSSVGRSLRNAWAPGLADTTANLSLTTAAIATELHATTVTASTRFIRALEVELHAEFEQPAANNGRRPEPRRTEGRVDIENRVVVEHVVKV